MQFNKKHLFLIKSKAFYGLREESAHTYTALAMAYQSLVGWWNIEIIGKRKSDTIERKNKRNKEKQQTTQWKRKV